MKQQLKNQTHTTQEAQIIARWSAYLRRHDTSDSTLAELLGFGRLACRLETTVSSTCSVNCDKVNACEYKQAQIQQHIATLVH